MKIQFKRSPYGFVAADDTSQRLFDSLHLNDLIELDYEHVGERVRTDQQRKAIEVFCRNAARVLNDAGLDKREVFAKMKEGAEIPWCQDGFKNDIWRQFQIAMLDKESTADLETKEVSQVYEVINRFLGERFGVHVPFPSRFG